MSLRYLLREKLAPPLSTLERRSVLESVGGNTTLPVKVFSQKKGGNHSKIEEVRLVI